MPSAGQTTTCGVPSAMVCWHPGQVGAGGPRAGDPAHEPLAAGIRLLLREPAERAVDVQRSVVAAAPVGSGHAQLSQRRRSARGGYAARPDHAAAPVRNAWQPRARVRPAASPLPGAQARTDTAEQPSEHLRDLRVGQVVVVAQDEHRPLARWERREQAPHVVASGEVAVVPSRALTRRSSVTASCETRLGRGRRRLPEMNVLTMTRRTGVRAVGLVDAAPLQDHLGQGVLEQVLGVLAVPGQRQGGAHEAGQGRVDPRRRVDGLGGVGAGPTGPGQRRAARPAPPRPSRWPGRWPAVGLSPPGVLHRRGDDEVTHAPGGDVLGEAVDRRMREPGARRVSRARRRV